MKNLTKKQKIIIGIIIISLLLITFFMGPDGYFRKQETATKEKIEETQEKQDKNMRRITGKEDDKDSETEEVDENEVKEPVIEDAFYLLDNNIKTPIDNMIDLDDLIAKGGLYERQTIYRLEEPYDEDTWIDKENRLSISREEENNKLLVHAYPKDYPEEEVIITFIITDPYEEEVIIESKEDLEEAVKSAQESITEEEKAEKIQELEEVKEEAIRNTSDTTNKDKYLTDPVPEGKPEPVEPDEIEIDTETVYTATLSIDCSTILDNFDLFNEEKIDVLPLNGVILPNTVVEFYKGESVFDVLDRTVKAKKIHMEYTFTPVYNSVYIEGINNLYEFDCGPLSGWMYKVNGWFPNYGCSRYQLQDGDVINWVYTCDLGADVGDTTMTGGQ